MHYQCPLCHQSLNLQKNSFRCENNHQFDVAKEGYVNLMPANQKRSKNPGDSTEMMQARRAFLNSGHYDKLANRVAEICSKYSNGSLLDIGCGEGYYTQKVCQQLSGKVSDAQVYGLDIAKVAVRYASKRYPDCHFSVASSHRLPFEDSSLDTILRIYAPCKAEELSRCIKEGGFVVTVTPAARHLYELRDRIYDGVRLHDESAESIEGFTLVNEEKLNYLMNLTGPEAADLLQMTPFAWKATPKFKAELTSAKEFPCEADFMIRVYQKI
ncbi:23S rRNA (guanine(745)-N(1))-methyltransferase [Vibrio sp. JC009]|uniref:23S rRNA (guanine(745)-N(1))-methyltransferase n=1 Tax=Vibrio sp. JC009 TaxID=2912314 RepID=UPI0023B0E2B2|nr:23S rRNA (guanine(745)-N(1))-methyltransferase [Vibrio sp. JC009]WED20949.1 23S rRNA (guanine(745)-N(1))-methyltransferase [Vibrio sp. JC009]